MSKQKQPGKTGDKAKKQLRLTRETIKDLDMPPSKQRNVKGGLTTTKYNTNF